jgi:hypothetical protein
MAPYVRPENLMKTTIILFALAASLNQVRGDTPPELKRLQEQRDRKIEEIDRVYLRELETLKIRYTKQGDLESANLVNDIIQSMITDKADKLPDTGEVTRWEWGSGGILTLSPEGVARHTGWNQPGKWRRESDGSIRLETGSRAFRIVFEDDIGKVTALRGGATTTIKLLE